MITFSSISTYGKLFHWPQTLSTHGKVVSLCDHQAAFQSFPLHLTMATNFLCPLQWNRVSNDSIWIVFQPWKTAFHKPLPHMKSWYFCDKQTAFQSFPLHLIMATNFLYPLRWHRVFTESIWIVFHPWKTPFHKPIPHMEWKGGISVTTRQLLSHFHCI